ncbi:solute carrier family 10 (sodium/bile acid cotransporter), member 7 [Marchantia polymorpha subsp. ruderalis]|uniref:Sodium/metabolite cotransporter BASS4, chloroplastic n=2 Tax=Marchantia polymorpha TaxID=3197 RepID=A0AAF6BUL8_MARPO|nr:hypothetical protein MARPO_0046s0115 [Marchantia polymorpha]BBN15702.1 hypothetical protein Mp_7g00090 [Marchantia polymorpha subsp. ruderalis]|eukprot:PTQ39305.1 hypothetical protein MARPO_0046s0115 [Marchantia polymorpha]
MEVVLLVSSACSVDQHMRCLKFPTPLCGLSSIRGLGCWKPPHCFLTHSFSNAKRRLSKECGPLLVGRQQRHWTGRYQYRPVQAADDSNFSTNNTAPDGNFLQINSPFPAGPDSQNVSEVDIRKEDKVHLFQALTQFVDSNFLPVALLGAMLLGLTWPAPGQALHRMGISKWVTTTFFLLFGLTSGSKDVEKAASAWPAGLFGMISILLLTPLAAIPILWLPITPRELATGLAIFASVPTTLSSGVALTQIAGANIGLALGLTVFSNLFSVVTMPFFLTGIVGQGIGVSIPPGPLLKSLIQTLLLPLILGKIVRETFPDLGKLMDSKRKYLSKITTLLMSLVPWMQMSNSRCMLHQIGPLDLFISIAAGSILHIVYLIGNSGLMKVWPLPSAKQDVFEDFNSRAVLIVSSEKSIIVAVAVIDRLGGVFGNAGLLLLPCIAAQLIQVTIDSALVSTWLQRDAGKKLGSYATQ